jgi:hypothetical protein
MGKLICLVAGVLVATLTGAAASGRAGKPAGVAFTPPVYTQAAVLAYESGLVRPGE